VTPENRDRCISEGFELCVIAILAALLLLPSEEFIPLLPADLRYAIVPILAAGLILLVVGLRSRVDEPRR
jgi:hypothetical protein